METISLGKIEHVKGKLYAVKERVAIGQTYTVRCPECEHVFSTSPEAEGICKARCEKCGVVIGYSARQQEKPSEESLKTEKGFRIPHHSKTCGMLQWGGFFFRKTVQLHVGTNLIGRRDNDKPSEIQFDDEFMSRQSVSINVDRDVFHGAYTFKLTVLRATNPIFVSGNKLSPGNSIYLNFGDTILLGNTKLTFKELQQ